LVRHGHLPEREIMTGIGPVAVRCPRVRDRGGEGCDRIRFSSAILLPYARRSKSLEVLIPILYLKSISTGDFEDALIALLGRDAGGLSASTIGRLKEAWCEEHARWSKRDLSAKGYIYVWVDGIHVQARHRTLRSKGRLSNKTALAMIFKLAESAEKSWRPS
jgi:transposase-like protein